ncbi:hypothetical protein TRV_06458 [Trichophyton verrucosum HKI 0517]|uniref:Uncharacterized protein n=1 Tax=Trichophyton verrucosum (strain HKI 0517) TaxID=663202 RepID=D4DH03_TRIVH|nr:uncharacterized protein TRV_06458 [Trichophyton verrucosum HKI 0517]EFE38876.1 hypothetical protein TRV_06458 [Trichophyton verrucosum HKI 0517]
MLTVTPGQAKLVAYMMPFSFFFCFLLNEKSNPRVRDEDKRKKGTVGAFSIQPRQRDKGVEVESTRRKMPIPFLKDEEDEVG